MDMPTLLPLLKPVLSGIVLIIIATLILLIQSGYKSGQWAYMFRYVTTGMGQAQRYE